MNATPPRKALYDIATAELERELRSGEALGTRAAALVGFAGLVLTLASTLGRDTVSRNLGPAGRPIAFFALSAGLVVVAAGAVTAASMFLPRPRGRTKPAVLRELRTAHDAEHDVYERLSKSVTTLFEEEGAKNDARGRRLGAAVWLVVSGLLLIAVQAVTLATTLSQDPCSTTRTTLTTQKTTRTPVATRRRRTTTTTVVTTSSTDCAKATRTTSKSANP